LVPGLAELALELELALAELALELALALDYRHHLEEVLARPLYRRLPEKII